jgi:FAD/FMN-containing dehydrogenase
MDTRYRVIKRERIALAGAAYLRDESKIIIAEPEAALKIVFPGTTEELEEITTKAFETGIPVRAQGWRSGLAGGCVPRMGRDKRPELVISMEEFLTVPDVSGFEKVTKPIETDTLGARQITYAVSDDGSEVLLPAGVTLKERKEILSQAGRMFPVQPTSQDASFGGNVKTNASGLEAAFGSTRDWVTRLGQVSASGARIDLARGARTEKPDSVALATGAGETLHLDVPTYHWRENLKNSSGIFTGPGSYPFDLFVGDEGALSICAYAGIRTLPKRTGAGEDVWTGVIFFDDPYKALDFVVEAASDYGLRNGTELVSLDGDGLGIVGIDWIGGGGLELAQRFLDKQEVRRKIPGAAKVALEVGLLMHDEKTAENVMELMSKYDVLEDNWFDPDAVDTVRALRHSVPVQINEKSYRKVGTDCAVPLDKLSEMHRYWEREAARYARYRENRGIPGPHVVEIGHPFNGHMHYNALATDESDYAEARILQGNAIRFAVCSGGVPSGEHGLGAKTALVQGREIPLMQSVYGEKALSDVQKIKKQMGGTDLNRGVMVPLE